MSLLAGAVVNELEKLFRKGRVPLLLVILAAIHILLTTQIYMNQESFAPDTNWQESLRIEIADLERELPHIPADQIAVRTKMQRDLATKKIQLTEQINPTPTGGAAEVGHSVTGPFITTFLPLLLIVIGANLISGEFSDGTVKSMLIRPVGRSNILMAKWIAFVLVSIGVMLFSDLLSYVTYSFVQGVGSWNDLIVVGIDTLAVYPLWKFVLIGLSLNVYTILTLTSVLLLISVLMRSVASSISLALILIVVGGWFTWNGANAEWVKYVFLTHLDLTAHLIGQFHLPDVSMNFSIFVLFLTAAGSLFLSFLIFTKRDMLI